MFTDAASTSSTTAICGKGTINFRDVSTHIKGLQPKKLYRSSECYTVESTSGFQLIIDLRRQNAWKHANPVPRLHVPFVGAKGGLSIMSNLPWSKLVEFVSNRGSEIVVGSYYFENSERIVDMYLRIVENAGHELHMIFTRLASEETTGGILIHCVAGKDRTGILVALLARLCDCTMEDIAHDYAVSQENIVQADVYEVDPHLAEYAHVITNSPKEAMLEFLHALDRKYGNVRSFLVYRAQLSSQVLDQVVRKLKAE